MGIEQVELRDNLKARNSVVEMVRLPAALSVDLEAALMVALMVSGKVDLMDEKVVVARAAKLEL